MGFIDSIYSSVFSEPFPKEPPYRVLLLGDRAGYFESVKSVISYSQTKIELAVKNSLLTIDGENLFIKKFCEGDVVICGKILSVKRG